MGRVSKDKKNKITDRKSGESKTYINKKILKKS